jgi:hypothetical protein
MADLISDGMTKVIWVTTISNTAAPTVAELNAGQTLEAWITPDGLGLTTSTDPVDNTSISSVQSTQVAGRRSDEIEITFKQQGQAAAPWTTFASRPVGYVVIRRGVATATAIANPQKVQVFPAQAGDRQMLSPAPNEVEKFSVKFFVTGPVVDTATVT